MNQLYRGITKGGINTCLSLKPSVSPRVWCTRGSKKKRSAACLATEGYAERLPPVRFKPLTHPPKVDPVSVIE